MVWETVKEGVLQGSVLGLLLFNIYLNDFPKIINQLSHIILFADDTSIFVTSTNYNELHQKLNSILHHIPKWFQTNQLILNANKAYIVKFTSSKALIYPLNIIHVDQTLAVAETTKFLGLLVDSHLSQKSQVNVLLKKLGSACFMMRKISYILNTGTLRTFTLHTFDHEKIWYNILGFIENRVLLFLTLRTIMDFYIYYTLDTVYSYGLYIVKSCNAQILYL